MVWRSCERQAHRRIGPGQKVPRWLYQAADRFAALLAGWVTWIYGETLEKRVELAHSLIFNCTLHPDGRRY
jgi:hypothetical protein